MYSPGHVQHDPFAGEPVELHQYPTRPQHTASHSSGTAPPHYSSDEISGDEHLNSDVEAGLHNPSINRRSSRVSQASTLAPPPSCHRRHRRWFLGGACILTQFFLKILLAAIATGIAFAAIKGQEADEAEAAWSSTYFPVGYRTSTTEALCDAACSSAYNAYTSVHTGIATARS
ncbi:hypothetical protein JCM8547_007926 [Rhodosporidiobolus lusitaniae]